MRENPFKKGDRVQDIRKTRETEITGIITKIKGMTVEINHITWYGTREGNTNTSLKHLEIAEVAR